MAVTFQQLVFQFVTAIFAVCYKYIVVVTRRLLQLDQYWLMAMKDYAGAKKQCLRLDTRRPTFITNCYAWGSIGAWRKSATQLLVILATNLVQTYLCLFFL